MKHIIYAISVFLVLTVLASCTDKEAMRQRLAYVSECNRADTVFTEAWLPTVDSLVCFFDRHGNAYERMMAHYLQGRIYHDMGEAPIALECYQKAAEVADTASKDSSTLHALAAIYGQMADLFHGQYLPDDEMQALMMSEHYARMYNDTLFALISYRLRTRPYFLRQDTDSMLYVTNRCIEAYRHCGKNDLAAQLLIMPISVCLDRGKSQEAWNYMQVYESESGYFDGDGMIMPGKELYFYYKGLYLLSQGQCDSAIAFFNKAVHGGFREAGYKGLLSAYEVKNIPDSIARYARLFAQANDNSYRGVEKDATRQAASMYNYSRQQRVAERERERAREAELGIIILALALSVAVLLGSFSYLAYRRYRENAQAKLKELKEKLEKSIDDYNKTSLHYKMMQNAYSILKKSAESMEMEKDKALSSLKKYERALAEMENERSAKDKLIQHYEEMLRNTLSGRNEENLQSSTIVKRMRALSYPKKDNLKPSKGDWDELEQAVGKYLPIIYSKIVTCQLSKQECKTCILVRLNFPTGAIANLLDTPTSRVAKVKSLVNEKLFGNTDARSLYMNLLQL